MNQIKQILDEYGIIYQARSVMPDTLWKHLILALAELEDNECHRTHKFPITNLRRLKGCKEPIYRANVDKKSLWRIHLQYKDPKLCLKQLVEPKDHDDPLRIVKSQHDRFELKSS